MPAPATSGVRVLVVDDDALVGESLAEFLHAEGFRPQVATSLGREAPAHPSRRPRCCGSSHPPPPP